MPRTCANATAAARFARDWSAPRSPPASTSFRVGRVELNPYRLELRPCDVSGFVALPVVDGHHPNLQWVADSTRTPGT